ncbi:GNAT family N-acetyltransferase [Candidatus Dojkabacteria bacterium]|nr:GNAT family N-acetyltransferase [Candidatus Dojkabacteria bacterium]
MLVQKAKLSDAIRVKEIVSQLNTENYNFSHLSKIKKYIRKGVCFVAKDKGSVVGAMVLKYDSTEACELKLLAVAKKGLGVGKELINHAEKFCREKGIAKLWCWSLIRYDAKGFYKKVGFEEDFLLKKQWYGEDAYFFGKVV